MVIDVTIHKGEDRVNLFNSGERYCFIGENGREISIDFTKDGINKFQPNSSASDEVAKWKERFDKEVKRYKRMHKNSEHYKAFYQKIIDHNCVGEIKLYKFNLIKKEVKPFIY